MAVFTVSVNKLNNEFNEQFKWCLDTPVNGFQNEGKAFQDHGLRMKGWFLKPRDTDAKLAILNGSDVSGLPLNSSRKDVIEKVALHYSELDDNITCGFDHTVHPHSDRLLVGMIYQSVFTPLYELSIQGTFKILEGKENWLFLDNDTNNSVEQFTGKAKLTRKIKKDWLEYADTFSKLTLSQSGKSVFLVAPSKEFVVEEYYPFKKSSQTPLDQLIQVAPDSFNLVVPTEALKHNDKRTFRVCDTHWSCHGAVVASLEVIAKQGINCEPVEQLFAKDKYKQRLMTGDLGSKVYPPRKHTEEHLTTFNYKRVIIYDNQLPNFGRALIMENASAVYDKSLLMYGSSSAYSMFNYLTRIFRTVVFFHTAGNIDRELTAEISPDYLLAQTNARFIVKAPSFDIKISDYIEDKLSRLDETPVRVVKKDTASEFSSKVIDLLEA